MPVQRLPDPRKTRRAPFGEVDCGQRVLVVDAGMHPNTVRAAARRIYGPREAFIPRAPATCAVRLNGFPMAFSLTDLGNVPEVLDSVAVGDDGAYYVLTVFAQDLPALLSRATAESLLLC